MEQEPIKKLPSVAEAVEFFTQNLGLTETERQFLRAYCDINLLEVERTIFMDSVVENNEELETEARERYGLGPNIMDFLDDVGSKIVLEKHIERGTYLGQLMGGARSTIERLYKEGRRAQNCSGY